MIRELWGAFPRLLEQNINGLLDTAEPSPAKAFMLYKTCKNEDLWRESFENFSRHLGVFFAKPRAQRRKSDFDRVLDRPMDQHLFTGFHLNFRTAVVHERALNELTSWAHNLIRVGKKTTSAVISLEVIGKTLHQIVNPPAHAKAENIEFEDFCEAWKQTVFQAFGKKHDTEFNEILKELRWIKSELELEANDTTLPVQRAVPGVYLTQTEIDWTRAVRRAATDNTKVPRYPLSRGPQKQPLIDLERAISLYEIVETSRFPELIQHRENIRVTILNHCEALLRDKEANKAANKAG